MLIVSGTKRTEKKLGLVADFCPICRDVRAFKLFRIGLASHIYFISFGGGKLAGHRIQCIDCNTCLSVDPTKYAAIENHRVPDVETLEHTTYPRLRGDHADRLALEAQVRRSPGTLAADQRANFLLEPFVLLNPDVEQRYANSTQMDKQSGIGCFATLLVLGALFAVVRSLSGPAQDRALIAFAIAGGLGLIYTFVQLGLSPGRFLRTKIVPVLAHALQPLEPSLEELKKSVEKCRAAEMKLGTKLKPELLWSELERRAAAPSEGPLVWR
jgi:hypothetical protein